MSARNFYQTFYQTDSLFRLADESWDTLTPTADPLPESEANQVPDLLAELDILAKKVAVTVEQPPVEVVLVEPVQIESIRFESKQPDPVQAEPIQAGPIQAGPIQAGLVRSGVSIPSPEPLPQSIPRPTVPSLLPPVQQQPRLPQLNHKVLLLADEELDPSNLLFLEKILKAVNLNVNGVDLLNLYGAQNMDFAELLRGKHINHFITFGVPFERLNLDIMMDRYAPVRFEGITFLMADSLPTIEADQNLKKRLWGALQRIFLNR